MVLRIFKQLPCKTLSIIFRASGSPFCRNTMKILCELYNCTEPETEASYDQDWEPWEELGIVGVNGLALILNAFPISFEKPG